MSKNTYKNQKREKSNISLLIGGRPNCKTSGRGANRKTDCFYPDSAKNCKANEVGTYKCDARKLSKNDLQNLGDYAQLRFFIDRAKINYNAAVSYRKKYSAYALETDGRIKLNSNGTGQLRPGFEYIEDPKAKKTSDNFAELRDIDFFTANGLLPCPKKNSTGSVALEWKNNSGRRYHYQGESRMRAGKTLSSTGAAEYLDNASIVFYNLYQAAGTTDQLVTDLLDAGFSSDEICALSDYYMLKVKAAESGDGNMYPLHLYLGTQTGTVIYSDQYEGVLRDLAYSDKKAFNETKSNNCAKKMGGVSKRSNVNDEFVDIFDQGTPINQINDDFSVENPSNNPNDDFEDIFN